MTVLGTTAGVAVQLVIVVLGLAAFLEFAASAFTWLKWAGVACLFYLGISSWPRAVEDTQESPAVDRPLRALFWQGLFLAMINPKTLLFSAAFLPQFVSADAGSAALVAAAITYLGVIFGGDLVWAASAQSARPLIRKLGKFHHRLASSSSGLVLAWLCPVLIDRQQ